MQQKLFQLDGQKGKSERFLNLDEEIDIIECWWKNKKKWKEFCWTFNQLSLKILSKFKHFILDSNINNIH